jgi:hypothetical protein
MNGPDFPEQVEAEKVALDRAHPPEDDPDAPPPPLVTPSADGSFVDDMRAGIG